MSKSRPKTPAELIILAASLKTAYDEISRLQLDRTVLIAVDGFGGSGKTTLANQLSILLGSCRIIHMDEWLIDKSANNTPELLGFDRDGIATKLLNPIILGENFSENSYMIVEGISALHPDFRDYFDYKIWINTSIEESTIRAIARDVDRNNEHLRSMWTKNDLLYSEIHEPFKSANIVVAN